MPNADRVQYRAAVAGDAESCIVLRGATRHNAIPRERLAAAGITAQSWGDDIASGALPGYVCTDAGAIVGYCFGATARGEIVVLALLPQYEGRGIGRELLGRVVRDLRALGFGRLYLGCSPDPRTRSYGFYRHLGWTSTGTFDAAGDEVLEIFLAEA